MATPAFKLLWCKLYTIFSIDISYRSEPTRTTWHISVVSEGGCECPDCGRKFKGSRSGEMCRTHYETVHLKLRRHRCGVCGKGFSQNGSMNRHQKSCEAPDLILSESGGYVCRYCSEHYKTKGAARKHFKSCYRRVFENKQFWVDGRGPEKYRVNGPIVQFGIWIYRSKLFF